MRILLDECVDPRCKSFFSEGEEVSHVKDLGWLGIKNGELVRQASEQFKVLFTIDSNMRYQTSLKGLSISVVIAQGHFRSLEDYSAPIQSMLKTLPELKPGEYSTV